MGNESEEGEETRRAMSRRKVLGLAAAAAAGLALTPLTEKAQAATGDALIIGKDNTANPGDVTRLDTTVDGRVPHHEVGGLSVQNYGSIVDGNWPNAIVGNCPNGIGVRGESYSGHGVLARSIEGAAMKADSDHGIGVVGTSGDGIGVNATTYGNGIALRVEGKSQCWADVVAHALDEFPPAFHVSNHGDYDPKSGLHPPVALAGYCPNGFAVHGSGDQGIHGHGASVGVFATSENGLALKVEGRSECHAKVDSADVPKDELPIAFSVFNDGEPAAPEVNPKPPVAIVGNCPHGMGVSGFSEDNAAVHGNSTNNAGVYGYSEKGIGVRAVSPDGTGLRVEGKSSFSTVGSGTIPAFKRSYTVGLPAGLVTDKSHISVTLTSDPNLIGEDAAVSFVVRDPTNNRFTINLTKAVGRETTFTYFIVEP